MKSGHKQIPLFDLHYLFGWLLVRSLLMHWVDLVAVQCYSLIERVFRRSLPKIGVVVLFEVVPMQSRMTRWCLLPNCLQKKSVKLGEPGVSNKSTGNAVLEDVDDVTGVKLNGSLKKSGSFGFVLVTGGSSRSNKFSIFGFATVLLLVVAGFPLEVVLGTVGSSESSSSSSSL
jgi:hypothetical protein